MNRYDYLSPGAMKLISALLATALMLPVAALAADRMPAKLVGNWCLDQFGGPSITNGPTSAPRPAARFLEEASR